MNSTEEFSGKDSGTIESVTIKFSDGTVRAVPVVDTAIIVRGGYIREGSGSTDGSFPTKHTLLLQWWEDADGPWEQ